MSYYRKTPITAETFEDIEKYVKLCAKLQTALYETFDKQNLKDRTDYLLSKVGTQDLWIGQKEDYTKEECDKDIEGYKEAELACDSDDDVRMILEILQDNYTPVEDWIEKGQDDTYYLRTL